MVVQLWFYQVHGVFVFQWGLNAFTGAAVAATVFYYYPHSSCGKE